MNTVVSFGLLLITLSVGIALTWSERRAAPIFISTFAVAAVVPVVFFGPSQTLRSEEHTSELQSLMRISYAVFCLKKKKPSTRGKQRHSPDLVHRDSPAHKLTSRSREPTSTRTYPLPNKY